MRRIAKEEFFRYFPISDRQRRWELFVNGVGRIARAYRGTPDQGHPAPYFYVWETGRVLDQFGLIYITQGQGEFESAVTARTPVEAGTFFILFPGVWHRYRAGEKVCWSYFWVHVGGEYLDRLCQRQVLSPKRPVFRTGLQPGLLQAYLSLLERAKTEPPGFQQMMCGNILEILGTALATEGGDGEAQRVGALVRQATLILERQMGEPIDLHALASSLEVSYDGFRHAFKKHTGFSPHQYLLHLRVNRAKELLLGTDLTVRQISASLGFADPYYFSRAFRKMTDRSPNAWRAEGQAMPGFRSSRPEPESGEPPIERG